MLSPSAGSAPEEPAPPTGRVIRRLEGHEARIEALAFSPDGATLASGSEDRTVRLWNVAAGKPREARIAAWNGLQSLAFSPDGKTLYGADYQGIHVWDAETGAALPPVRLPERFFSAAFAPNTGQCAVCDDEGVVWLGDLQGRREARALDRGPMKALFLAFSPDGKTLAGAGSSLSLWDVGTGEKRTADPEKGNPSGPLAFLWGGKTLAVGGSFGTALWDVGGVKEGDPLNWDGSVALAASPDGGTLAAAGGRNGIGVWDVDGKRRRFWLREHEGYVRALAFSPDGRTLASAGDDRTIRLWDVTPEPGPPSAGVPAPSPAPVPSAGK